MDLDQIQKSVIDLKSYPIDKWNPKLCQNVSFRINGEGKWFYNESEIKRIAMVKLFSKLIKYEDSKYYVVTPTEKISLNFEKEIFYIIDFKRIDSDYYFKTNTEEWVKLTRDNELNVSMVDGQPYPRIRVKKHIWGLLSRNIFYKIITEADQNGDKLFLISDGVYFYLN